MRWRAIGTPPSADEAVAECGRVEKRHRLLPTRVVVYFVLAMWGFRGFDLWRATAATSKPPKRPGG